MLPIGGGMELNMEHKETDKRKKIILDLMEEEFYVPMKEKELAVMLQVSKEDRVELNRILN